MDNIQFQNMDSWRSSGGDRYGLTFKQIVLQHINRCVVNGSVEWHGGYWQERNAGQYTVEKIYIQNSRDVFCNSVRMLRACLLGYFDEKIKKADEKLQKQINERYEQYVKEVNEGSKKYAKAEYFSDKVDLYITMFEQLIMLAKRLNFFEEETSEEEV